MSSDPERERELSWDGAEEEEDGSGASESESDMQVSGSAKTAADAAAAAAGHADDHDVEMEDGEQPKDASRAASEDDDPSPPPQPRLKIKLKLPVRMSSTSNSGSTPTPAPEEPATSTPRHRLRRPPSRDIDIESEDEDDDDPADGDADGDASHSTTSTSAGPSSRPMTTRQAVLAAVVDSTHVSLSGSQSKKKLLNESEIALRREETARKRKNLSEKKLEVEKAETINRLLKKQSRPKNKRTLATPGDRTPQTRPAADDDADADMEPAELAEAPPAPMMYRWVSRAAVAADGERHMALELGVPLAVTTAAEARGAPPPEPRVQGARPGCDVEGCGEARKYRLVSDWTKGACGMGHLKVLQAKSITV